MANYQLSSAMSEDKLLTFLQSTEGTGWDTSGAPDGNDQWRVLTDNTTSTVIHNYTYRLLPAEEGRLPEVLSATAGRMDALQSPARTQYPQASGG